MPVASKKEESETSNIVDIPGLFAKKYDNNGYGKISTNREEDI